MALEEEINQKIKRLDQICSPEVPMVVPRIIVMLSRHVHGEALLRELLKPSVEELLGDSEKSEHLNTDPLEIYKYVVGPPTKGMTAQQAADDPAVAQVLLKAINYLVEWADKFRIVIANGKEKIPYGLRYMSKVMKNALHAKFPQESEKEILKAVGRLVYDEFISPAISSPDSVHIIEKDRAISQLDRKKLASVAKLLQYGSANKGYGDDKSYLTPLNPHIKRFHSDFRTYLSEICNVPEPEEKFGIDRYNDYTVVNKPTVFLALGDLLFFHGALLEFRQLIAPDKQDPMNAMIDEAGVKVPRVQDIAGQQDSAEVEQMQLTLTLSPKRSPVLADGQDEDRQLFLATKKYVLDLLLSQSGDSLTAMLNTPATVQEEQAHRDHVQKSGGSSIEEFKSLEAKKEHMRANLRTLEAKGLVSSSDDYQAIVSAIAADIRKERKYRDVRRTELEHLRDTAGRLDAKRRFFNDQVDKYNEYLDTCLDNLNRNN
uniref:Ras-GAP domain-containing protein n=1 Tax=Plectus sambesii TaxID=2011161 RepID=A0A914UHN1_9BILA